MSFISVKNNLHKLDWNAIKMDLDDTGYAVLPKLFNDDECLSLLSL